MMTKPKTIKESSDLSKCEHVKGEFKNIPILGRKSANNRDYTDPAMEQLAGMYDGYLIWLDHSGKPTEHHTTDNLFGSIHAPKFNKSEGMVRGNLCYLESHPFAARLKESKERNLPYFGLSHVIVPKWGQPQKNGRETVEGVVKLLSVDLVAGAATNSIVEQDESLLPIAEEVEGYSHEEDVNGAFETMVCAVMKDTNLDRKAKLSKLKTILAHQEKMLGDDGKDEGAEPKKEEEQTAVAKELKAIKEQLAAVMKGRPAKYTAPAATPVGKPVREQTKATAAGAEKEFPFGGSAQAIKDFWGK